MNRAFLRSLYEEHLEEISSLYERRLGLLDDTEIDIEDLVSLEARVEAHLDALVVGAEPALELCAERALDGDPGELFGALCVMCRQGRPDLFEATLARFEEDADDDEDEGAADEEPSIEAEVATATRELGVEAPEDEDDGEGEVEADEATDDLEEEEDDDDEGPTPAGALADALSAEGPPAWQAIYERVLAEGRPAVASAVGRMVGVRGFRLGPQVAQSAARLGASPHVGPMLWALGRIRERSAVPVLNQHAQRFGHDEAMIATLALLRFGDPSMLDYVVRASSAHPWAVSLLAIAGGPAVAPIIREHLARAEVGAEEIIAAGLFGDLAVVPRLIECLGPHPEAAAQGLYLLTGASIVETVLEPVDEADELETLPNGEPDPRNEVEVERLSQDPAVWRQWWEDHLGAFTAGRRYRLGQLACAEVLGHTLHRLVLRQPVRQLAAEEIGLRYWPQRDLDVDQWAGPQQTALAGLPTLRETNAVIAKADGAWVFARNLQR